MDKDLDLLVESLDRTDEAFKAQKLQEEEYQEGLVKDIGGLVGGVLKGIGKGAKAIGKGAAKIVKNGAKKRKDKKELEKAWQSAFNVFSKGGKGDEVGGSVEKLKQCGASYLVNLLKDLWNEKPVFVNKQGTLLNNAFSLLQDHFGMNIYKEAMSKVDKKSLTGTEGDVEELIKEDPADKAQVEKTKTTKANVKDYQFIINTLSQSKGLKNAIYKFLQNNVNLSVNKDGTVTE